jgi:hypothetical protein
LAGERPASPHLGIDDGDRGQIEVDPADTHVAVEHPLDSGDGVGDDALDPSHLAELAEDLGGDLLGHRAGDGRHQALLGAVVVGDQRLRLAGPGRHLGEARPGIALGLHHLECRFEDALAGARRGAPARTWRCCWAHAVASIAGSRPIAASFFESAFAAYSKISLEW